MKKIFFAIIVICITAGLTKQFCYARDILPEEIPELGYSYSPVAGGDTYICYKNILILGDDVYRYENGNYIKTGETIQDMLGIEGNMLYYFRQYNNMIVACNYQYFLLYDMDTDESFTYLVQDDSESFGIRNWYLYDGCLYYLALNEIRKMNLSDGEEQVICSKKGSTSIVEFAMRGDGKILYECLGSGKREYYLMEPCDNEKWKEKKIWETDGNRWKSVIFFACNQYGLFQIAEFSDYQSRPDGTISSTEDVIIREDGTVKNFDIEVKGGCSLFLDTGCLVSDISYSKEMLNEDSTHLLCRRVSSVTFYDYAGNALETYQLIEPEILQDGYYMRKLIYHDGKITALYTQEDTGKLYIAQVEAEGLEYEKSKRFSTKKYI